MRIRVRVYRAIVQNERAAIAISSATDGRTVPAAFANQDAAVDGDVGAAAVVTASDARAFIAAVAGNVAAVDDDNTAAAGF